MKRPTSPKSSLPPPPGARCCNYSHHYYQASNTYSTCRLYTIVLVTSNLLTTLNPKPGREVTHGVGLGHQQNLHGEVMPVPGRPTRLLTTITIIKYYYYYYYYHYYYYIYIYIYIRIIYIYIYTYITLSPAVFPSFGEP